MTLDRVALVIDDSDSPSPGKTDCGHRVLIQSRQESAHLRVVDSIEPQFVPSQTPAKPERRRSSSRNSSNPGRPV